MWASIPGGCPSSLDTAFDNFKRGEYTRALGDLQAEPLSHARIALEAHILYWANRRRDAVHVLRTGRATLREEPASVSRFFDALLAAALASCGESDAARAVLPSPATPCNDAVACYAASAHLALGEYDAALNALASSETAEASPSNLFFRGWALAFKGDVEGQIRCAIAALDLLGPGAPSDVGLAARFLWILAALGRETMHEAAIGAVESSRLPWTSDLTVERFQALRMLAWAHSIRGDHIRAGEELARAAAMAPDAYSRMLAHLDRAWVAQVSNETVHQRIELAQAQECAGSIDWTLIGGEEAGGLLLLAKLTASVDASRATAYLDLAQTVLVASFMGLGHGERLSAFRLEAESAVAGALGNRRDAARKAKAAIEILERCGYRWRAANLAVELYNMTGTESWLDSVADVAREYPRSFVGAQFHRLVSDGRGPLDVLTKRQREIVALIRNEGLRNDDIAARLSMSANTVRIHKQKIYRAFHVSNEFQLLAKLNRLAS